jgi:hypothetical protein
MNKLPTSRSETLSTTDLRKFGLIMASGIVLIFGLFLPWLADRPINIYGWPWRISAGLLLLGLVVPIFLKPVYIVWMRVGLVLGYINTRIILGLIYLIVFTPVALLLKVLKKDPMSRVLDKELKSYRIKSAQPKLENLNRPY